MLVRSILSSYYRLLAGIMLAGMAIALTGCDDTVAEKAAPGRPVLVATVHYEPECPERSFVGTIRPGSRPTWAFGSPARSPSAWSRSARPSISGSRWRRWMKST